MWEAHPHIPRRGQPQPHKDDDQEEDDPEVDDPEGVDVAAGDP